MTYVVAQRINPTLPVELCSKVGTILERELRELCPTSSEHERARDCRGLLASMDVLTAVDILCAEGHAVPSC